LQIAGASGNFNNVSARVNGISLGANVGYVNARFDIAWDIGRDATSGAIFSFYSDNGSTNVSAGSITVSGSATGYNTSSDRRIKENIATTTAGLSTLLQIPVNDFNFISDPSKLRQQGFIAQDLYKIYPELVSTNGDNGIVPLGASSTPWSVDYGRITPLIVKAVQDIANLADTFKNTLIAWLASAANGITDLFAGNIHAQNELCVGSTCVTEAQFKAMVAAANQSPSSSAASSSSQSSTASSTASSTPPTITLMGNNPASIQVGSTYNDLGATAKDTQGHDLDVRYFLNGALVSNIVIDTSTVATDTIDYVATDTWGNTATSTRDVIVEEATSTSQ
jgi:hypothetical protein